MDYKTIALNSLGAIAIGGAVVTGGYYYMTLDSEVQEVVPNRQFPRISTVTIKDLLTEKNILSLEDEQDDDNWKKLVEKHLDGKIDPKQKLPISGVEIKSGEENEGANIGILKNTCKILLTKTKNPTSNIAIAENWCTKESEFLKPAAAAASPLPATGLDGARAAKVPAGPKG